MDIYQDLNPRGLASKEYGGITYRLMIKLEDSMTDDQIRHAIYYSGTGIQVPKYYSWATPINFKLMSEQAKQAGIKFCVNNSIHLVTPNTSIELFARVSGIIADLLEDCGWTQDNGAIALFNEPGKYLGQGTSGAKQYVEYVKRANDYVRGRFPLWLVNDEYHLLDEEYIFTHTTEVPKRAFGVHHLSSLGKTPAWKHVEYAATQAATWGVPVGCSEGGAWFHPYRSTTGHAINVKLLEECNKWNYNFCAIVCIQNNEWTIANTWGTLGYLIYNNDYTKLTRGIEYWNKWLKILKIYKKEEEIMTYLRPLVQQEFYNSMGWGNKPYHENTPSLPIVGCKNTNSQITWADFDAVMETILKGIISGLKENGALPEAFPEPMDIKYNPDGSWNNNWSEVAKSNPEQ